MATTALALPPPRGGAMVPAGSRVAPRPAGMLTARSSEILARGTSHVKAAAKEFAISQRHLLYALGAAAVIGWGSATGTLSNLPRIRALGTPGTYGVLAYVGGWYLKNKALRYIGTGLLCIAIFGLVRGHFLESAGANETKNPELGANAAIPGVSAAGRQPPAAGALKGAPTSGRVIDAPRTAFHEQAFA